MFKRSGGNGEKGKRRDRRINTLDKHVYMKATTSATDVREDKVIGPFSSEPRICVCMCVCVSQSEMMTAVRGEKKNR